MSRRKGFRALGPYARKDGRFEVLVRGPRVDGEGTGQRTFYFETQREAVAAKAEIAAELRRRYEITLADSVEQYLTDELRGARELKASTIATARARLNPLIRLAPDLLCDVRPRHVHQRLDQIDSAAGRRGTLVRMSDFFGWAVTQHLAKLDPTAGIEVKAKAKRGKVTLTRAEARTLDAHLWTEIDSDGADAQVARAIVLLLYLGLRRGEVLRLQVRDIDGAVLSIERVAKSRTSFRDIEVPARVAQMLAEVTAGRALGDWLWPSPSASAGHRGPTWLLKGTRRLCEAAGVTPVCPQGLRGTHSKLARTAGQTAHAVQAQLGHEDARTTRESYIGGDVDQRERVRKAFDVLEGDLIA